MSRSCYLDFADLACRGPACLDWAFVNGEGNLVRLPVCDAHAGSVPLGDSMTVSPSTSSEEVRKLILVNQVMAS